MTEMDFSTNSFVRSCSLDCELKPVDVVSDKNNLKKQDLPLLLRVLHADVQFVTGSCLGPVWLHFLGGFTDIF